MQHERKKEDAFKMVINMALWQLQHTQTETHTRSHAASHRGLRVTPVAPTGHSLAGNGPFGGKQWKKHGQEQGKK